MHTVFRTVGPERPSAVHSTSRDDEDCPVSRQCVITSLIQGRSMYLHDCRRCFHNRLPLRSIAYNALSDFTDWSTGKIGYLLYLRTWSLVSQRRFLTSIFRQTQLGVVPQQLLSLELRFLILRAAIILVSTSLYKSSMHLLKYSLGDNLPVGIWAW